MISKNLKNKSPPFKKIVKIIKKNSTNIRLLNYNLVYLYCINNQNKFFKSNK